MDEMNVGSSPSRLGIVNCTTYHDKYLRYARCNARNKMSITYDIWYVLHHILLNSNIILFFTFTLCSLYSTEIPKCR